MSTQWARPSGASWGMNVIVAPKALPSPSASVTSGAVSPMMTPISVMPAATIASMP